MMPEKIDSLSSNFYSSLFSFFSQFKKELILRSLASERDKETCAIEAKVRPVTKKRTWNLLEANPDRAGRKRCGRTQRKLVCTATARPVWGESGTEDGEDQTYHVAGRDDFQTDARNWH